MAEGIITTSDAEFRGILEERPTDAAGHELRRLVEGASRHRVPPPVQFAVHS